MVGIDWSGATDAVRRAWVCRAEGAGATLRVTELYRVAERRAGSVEDLLAHVENDVVAPPGERWVGLDFPFSITRGVARHLGHASWRSLVSSWETLFPDPGSFAGSCTAASLAVAGTREGRRRTDRLTGAPMSPWNLRLFRQTYHGMRLLGRLAGRRGVAVLPWDRADGAAVRVAEICPAALLAASGERSRDYKGRRASHASRRAGLLRLCRDDWGVRISRRLAPVVTADPGGDALDAVLAAVSAYHGAARLAPAEHVAIRAAADLLEGHVYVGSPAVASSRA